MTFWLHGDHVIYSGQPGALAQYIPDLKTINGSYFAVPKTLGSMQIMAWYRWPVPMIMTDSNYDFPIEPGKKPLAHQRLMANFMLLHPRCFNLGDPGTMKTLPTLWMADFLMQHHEPGAFRVLVITTLSTIETVWAHNIFRNFLGRRTFEMLTGDPDRRIKRLQNPVDFYLLNMDGLKIGAHVRRKIDPRFPKQKRIELDGFSAALAARKDIGMVIVDEADGLKDPGTIRHICATKIFGDNRNIKMLTGTPTPNRPTDAYGMAKLINNAYGKSATGFKMETMVQVTAHKWVPKRDGYDKAKMLLTPAIRFGLDEIWDGPPMTIQRRKVELTDEQKQAMRQLKVELQVLTQSGARIDAANESAARQKLIQIGMGAIYDSNHVPHYINAVHRYAELEHIIEHTSRKVLIFVPITSAVHLVVRYLKERWRKNDLDWTTDFINGETSAKDRPKIINAFANDPKFKAVVADPQATAQGINEFVAADTVVWFGPVDKAMLWIQGNARVRRPGQKYPSTCFQLVSNKLEEEIFDRLENNTSMQGLMLDAIRKGEF